MQNNIVLPNGFLSVAEEELRNGHSVRLHADGQSMFPFIRGLDDEIEIEPLAPDTPLQPMAVYFYRWNGQYMVHRYIGEHNGLCVMLGDGNYCRTEEVPRCDISGKVRHIYRKDGSIQDCEDPNWLNKGKQWVWLRPLRRIILPVWRRLYRRFSR